MPALKTETEDKPKIGVPEAARAAMRYFQKLFPEVRDFSLEEVELSDNGEFWMITLGYDVLPDPMSIDVKHLLTPPKTKFKVFKVNARTGEVVSMKIRSVT